MMKRFSKKENLGITLIALVITIIVLLILAGVSINYMFGNEGIFTKTQTAVEQYQNAQEDEKKMLNEVAYYIDENYQIKNVRDFESSRELYKLNNPTWQAVPIANLNDDVNNYKMLRIDFISCWWENTTECSLIGNMWVDVRDIAYKIQYSCNKAEWYIYNNFSITNRAITFNNAANLLYNGGNRADQTINIYRVVGYK